MDSLNHKKSVKFSDEHHYSFVKGTCTVSKIKTVPIENIINPNKSCESIFDSYIPLTFGQIDEDINAETDQNNNSDCSLNLNLSLFSIIASFFY